jgi:thiol-disulfide isomerase/thioredoxin
MSRNIPVAAWVSLGYVALVLSPWMSPAQGADEGPVQEVWGQVVKALESANSLKMTISYSWQNRKESEEPARFEAVMTRNNCFRVQAFHKDALLAEMASDGKEIVEWDHRTGRWTRYPFSERELGSTSPRLLIDCTGQIPLTSAFTLLGSSWVTAPTPYEWHLQLLREDCENVAAEKAAIGGRSCDVLVGKATQRFGLVSVDCSVRLSFDSASHLPVREEKHIGATTFSASRTWWHQFEKTEVDAPVDAQVFTLKPPEGATFVEPSKLEGGELVGQNIGSWKVKLLDGGAKPLIAPGARDPVVIVVWASWCIPCKAELAVLAKLRERGELKNVDLLAVSVDKSKQQLQDFLARSPLALAVGHDPEFLKRVGTSGVPTTLVVSPAGTVRSLWCGWPSDPNDASSVEKLRQAVAGAAR